MSPSVKAEQAARGQLMEQLRAVPDGLIEHKRALLRKYAPLLSYPYPKMLTGAGPEPRAPPTLSPPPPVATWGRAHQKNKTFHRTKKKKLPRRRCPNNIAWGLGGGVSEASVVSSA